MLMKLFGLRLFARIISSANFLSNPLKKDIDVVGIILDLVVNPISLFLHYSSSAIKDSFPFSI